MKKIYMIMAFMLFATVSYSKEIPLEKAYMVAEEFFGITSETKDAGVGIRLLWDGKGLASRSVNTSPAFYVFERTGAEGFVIVSGDDALRPVLAWSKDSSFKVDDIPENSLWWFDAVEKQVAWFRQSSAAPCSVRSVEDHEEVYYQTAEWDQNDPYNMECPLDISSRRCITGCVATAMAIVMHQRQWPDAGTGVLSAYKTSTGIEVKERVLGQKYDWENLPFTDAADSRSNWSENQIKEVARVMADCGSAIQANYGYSSTSGAGAFQALVKYMKYDRSAYLDWRGCYTDEEWFDLVRSELSTNGAVLYSAEKKDGGGHSFVIDGYSSEGLFHVNWGWGGSNNAYYHLLNMNSSTFPYVKDHNMVFSLKPDEGGKSIERILFYCTDDLKGLGVEAVDPESGLPSEVTLGGFWNTGTAYYSGYVRLGVFDREMTMIKELWNCNLDDLAPTYYISFSNIPIQIGDVDFGYRLAVQFYNNVTGEWELVRANSEYNGITEILLADEYTIEDSTVFGYIAENDMIVITVKNGVSVSCTGDGGQSVDVKKLSENEYHIDASALGDWVYVLHLEKEEEYVEVEFVTGG